MTSDQIALFQQAVLALYQKTGRILPWRQAQDPYRVMVSEMMLQQTQVPRVIEKYSQWLKLFPTAQSLAVATPAEVIHAWAGLGYNRRALFLQRAAQAVSAQHSFPSEYQELIKLPGVGPYTAAAICSFAYNQDIALVDTNVKRIYQLLVFGDDIEPTEKQLLAIAQQYLPEGRSRDWHNALMDVGTVISKERSAFAQQQKLKQLFPVLNQFALPLVKDQPLTRAKQSPFKQSRRYWRGRVVDLLRTHSQLTISEVKKILNPPIETKYSLEEVVDSLVRDTLVVKENDIIRLPSRHTSGKQL